MPTIKEKLEASSNAAPEWSVQFSKSADDRAPYYAWREEHNKLATTLEAQSYRDAQATLHDLETELNRAVMERDKLQKTVGQIQAKLKVAEHVVNVLGAVEVP